MIPRPAGAASDRCSEDPISGAIECDFSGTIPGDPAPPPGRNPIRYLYTTTIDGADCHYWSRRPGGIDTWDPANDPATIAITTGLPECVWPDVEDRAWEIFRSFPLAVPDPTLEPPGAGIVNLPTFVSLTPPAAVTHSEVLPDGRLLEVVAEAVAVEVDWGDGSVGSFLPGEALPYPDGSVTHAYVYRTCDPGERAGNRGGPCHPSLGAYPVAVSLVWEGRWRTDPTAVFAPLDQVARTVTVDYPVDEVQGVLVDP